MDLIAPGQHPVVLAKGRPFSVDALDVTLPLFKLSARLYASVDRISHFELRLDYLLPLLQSHDASQERRIAAAYLCHQPYRASASDPSCHPFRQVLSTLQAGEKQPPPALKHALEILLDGSDQQLEALGSRSPQEVVRSCSLASDPASGLLNRIAELLGKAQLQTLSMGEQRHLASYLVDAVDPSDSEAGRLPRIWLAPLIEPQKLLSAGANNPMITCEIIGRLCCEALSASRDDESQAFDSLRRYLQALQKLPPTLRSFDLVTRLLRSDRPAPAPVLISAHGSTTSKLSSTVSHLTRSLTLGGFLSNAIRYLEQRESDGEADILVQAREAGLPEPSRRDIEERLEKSMSREVSIFCHFVRSLINAALLFAPELGSLRRQITQMKQALDPEQAALVETAFSEMEAELESGTQAMLIELQHFALRFGRYRDGTRLYGELTSLA